MELQELEQYIDTDTTPDISKRFEMKALIDKHPYFQAGIFVYLKCLFVADDSQFRPELQRLSISITDKHALFYYVLSSEYETLVDNKKEKKKIAKSRTDILLNAFFETMDDSAIDKQIEYSSPLSSDYLSYLENKPSLVEENAPSPADKQEMKHQDIIDQFINNTKDEKTIKLEPIKDSYNEEEIEEESDSKLAEELQDELFFTETLAKIYIKQHKYERALEIIKRLSLNYPKKNTYFAIQISFLEKLITNKNYKK